MSMSVALRARSLGTYRYVSVHLMETLARWVPTSPELEVKVLFGEHIWELAQHADRLGHRTFEVRAPLHHTLSPTPEYQNVLDELRTASRVPDRIHGLYEVVLPGLDARYAAYLATTDALADAPSVRLLEDVRRGIERMRADSVSLRKSVHDLGAPDAGWLDRLAGRQAGVSDIVAASAASAPKEAR